MEPTEKTIENIYNRILKEIVEPLVGTDITYDSDLDMAGQSLMGKDFKGVFPSDKLPDFPGLYIFNVDTSEQSGTHWIATVITPTHTYIYDSFGRKSIKLVPHTAKKILGKGKLRDTDYDAEQEPEENNCGARCLAWLICCKHLGIEASMKI